MMSEFMTSAMESKSRDLIDAVESLGNEEFARSVRDAIDSEKIFGHRASAITDWGTAAQVCSVFEENLAGTCMQVSQYGIVYATVAIGVEAEARRRLGDDVSRRMLIEGLRRQLAPISVVAPVAVWRLWPQIERNADNGLMKIRGRLHVLAKSANLLWSNVDHENKKRLRETGNG